MAPSFFFYDPQPHLDTFLSGWNTLGRDARIEPGGLATRIRKEIRHDFRGYCHVLSFSAHFCTGDIINSGGKSGEHPSTNLITFLNECRTNSSGKYTLFIRSFNGIQWHVSWALTKHPMRSCGISWDIRWHPMKSLGISWGVVGFPWAPNGSHGSFH